MRGRTRKPRLSLRDIVWLALRFTNVSLLVLIAAAAGVLLGTYSGIAEIIPRARDLGDIRPGQASRVLSAEGELLGQISTERRQFVPLEEMPPELQEAVIATEDREFYKHIGIDPRGIVRAGLHDLLALGPRQGGSTITQQLARSVYLSQAKTITRKIAEVVLALQLERAYTKPEILELYLNQIYFGEGAYGAQIAAKTYFDKDVADLSLSECALLAGLPKRPEHYSPFKDEQRAAERRNMVLALMTDEGYITSEQAARAKAAPIKLAKERKPLGLATYKAPYFTNYVLREVAKHYGPDALYKGGMTIYTTLNMEMQQAAEDAVRWGIEYAHARRGWNVGEVALIALNARTGAMKAMVGGADFKTNQYNVITQGHRQAGSAFKPFVYTAALEAGYTPDSVVNDAPVSYRGAGGKTWSPKNYGGGYSGRVTFRKALYQSINIPAVKVAERVGITSVMETAERMGIVSPLEPYLPLAIGAGSVTPLEMASAFSVFATRGMRTEPYGISKIVDSNGDTIYEHKAVTWRVLDEGVAETMVDMLSDVIKRGTAAAIRRQLTFPAAGKTGTTNDHRDAWFVGFTDDLTAAVWAGNLNNSPMGRVAGASLPAPVWARFMVKAQPIMLSAQEHEEERAREITTRASEQGAEESPHPSAQTGSNPDSPAQSPDTGARRICPTSGLLAGPNCPNPVEVTYDPSSGAEPPTDYCDVHGAPPGYQGTPDAQPRVEEPPPPPAREETITLPICAITNKIATGRCPLVVNRTFRVDEAPTETCDRHESRTPGM
ncbi:MAG: transglycosylase domain-containing protein [Armatimonadota bacterium]